MDVAQGTLFNNQATKNKIIMKAKIRFNSNAFRSKNDFSLRVTPTLWIIHNSCDTRKKLAKRHNKSKSKLMYNYTSIYLSWLIWSIVLTIGKE